MRNWSLDTLEREVKLNLAYRDFAQIGLGKVPDAKTLARIPQALGGDLIARLHGRLVKMAQQQGVVRGRKMRSQDACGYYGRRPTFITRPIRPCWATARG